MEQKTETALCYTFAVVSRNGAHTTEAVYCVEVQSSRLDDIHDASKRLKDHLASMGTHMPEVDDAYGFVLFLPKPAPEIVMGDA